jgi:type I restriction enzyme R subunit
VDGVLVTILAERVEYLDANGKLITESLKEYSKKALKNHFSSLDAFIKKWDASDRKKVIIEELETEGLLLDALSKEFGGNLDPFDLILHVAFDQPVLTRKQRAEGARASDVFDKYGPKAKSVLEALLMKYQDDGETDLTNTRILTLPPVSQMGTPVEIVKWFGSRIEFEVALKELQHAIYEKVS